MGFSEPLLVAPGPQPVNERCVSAPVLSAAPAPAGGGPLRRRHNTVEVGALRSPSMRPVLAELARARDPVADFRLLQRRFSVLSTAASDPDLGGGDGRAAKLSADQVGLAVANLVVGNALFTIPYGFALCGWSAVPLVVGSTGLSLFTARLLGDVLEELGGHGGAGADYGDIAAAAFGPKVSPVLAFCCCGECFFMLVFMFVFVGSSLGSTFGLPAQTVILAAAPVALLVKMVPARYFSLLRVLGLLLTLAACAACVFSGLRLDEASTTQSTFGGGGLAGAFTAAGAVAVCVSDHPVFPSVYHSSASKAAFQRGLGIGFAAFLAIALALSVATYASFGTALQPVLLTNIGFDARHRPTGAVPGWLAPVCNVALSARCIQVMPSFLSPIAALAHSLASMSGMDLSAPPEMESELALAASDPRKCIARVSVIGSILLLCTLCSVLCADLIDVVEALMSALFKSVNAFIIPCWGYYAVCGGRLQGQPRKRLVLFAVLAVGIAWGVVGTISAVRSIVAP